MRVKNLIEGTEIFDGKKMYLVIDEVNFIKATSIIHSMYINSRNNPAQSQKDLQKKCLLDTWTYNIICQVAKASKNGISFYEWIQQKHSPNGTPQTAMEELTVDLRENGDPELFPRKSCNYISCVRGIAALMEKTGNSGMMDVFNKAYAEYWKDRHGSQEHEQTAPTAGGNHEGDAEKIVEELGAAYGMVQLAYDQQAKPLSDNNPNNQHLAYICDDLKAAMESMNEIFKIMETHGGGDWLKAVWEGQEPETDTDKTMDQLCNARKVVKAALKIMIPVADEDERMQYAVRSLQAADNALGSALNGPQGCSVDDPLPWKTEDSAPASDGNLSHDQEEEPLPFDDDEPKMACPLHDCKACNKACAWWNHEQEACSIYLAADCIKTMVIATDEGGINIHVNGSVDTYEQN